MRVSTLRWARSDASRASTLQRSLPESERCGGLTESVRHGSRARGSRSAFCFSYARPAREIRSETSTITPEPTAPTIRSRLFRRSDPMPEQRRPDTPEPTDDRRRGGPGREIELRFSGSGSVVGMVSLCHTDEWRTRDRIGPRLIRIISLYRVRGSRAPDLFRISLGGSGEDDEGGVEERRLSSRGGTLREVVGARPPSFRVGGPLSPTGRSPVSSPTATARPTERRTTAGPTPGIQQTVRVIPRELRGGIAGTAADRRTPLTAPSHSRPRIRSAHS